MLFNNIPFCYNIYNMAESGIFDRLVSGLPLEERKSLFEKLKGQTGISSEPLYTEEKEFVPADAGIEYSRLPWYYRLWYFILSLFKGKSPLKIFEDMQISALGNKTEEKSPGLYDWQRNLLLPAFCRQMVKLKEAVRFFYSALDTSVGRDRGAFFAFLGSLEMPELHKRLQAETNPEYVIGKSPNAPDKELRQSALKAMDDAFSMITEDNRNNMYLNARSIHCLKELSSFLYDRVIMAFGFNSAVNADACSVAVIRELLLSLNNILISLKRVPDTPLLQSLFIFTLQERSGEPGFDMNREIRSLLTKAEESLAVIREFNKQVPLTWIIRCSTRNMSHTPREISGGEDWFVIYRDYWKRHIEALFAEYLKERRHRELLDAFRSFFRGANLKTLSNAQSDSNPGGLPIKGTFGLSFLVTFYSAVFIPELNKVLRPVLIDAEFQNKENRAEYAESYSNILKLEDEIKKFDQEISPSGDYGKRYNQARQEMTSLPVKRRKIQIVTEEASGDAGEILKRAGEAFRSMANILNGILGGDSKGKYGPLSNFTKLAGKDGQFNAGLEAAVKQFQDARKLLDDIETMESGR